MHKLYNEGQIDWTLEQPKEYIPSFVIPHSVLKCIMRKIQFIKLTRGKYLGVDSSKLYRYVRKDYKLEDFHQVLTMMKFKTYLRFSLLFCLILDKIKKI